MSHHHNRKRIAALLQLRPPLLKVQQLDHRKIKRRPAPQRGLLKLIRPPAWILVGENRKARDRVRLSVERAIVIGEHAPREIVLLGALDFNVNHNPLLATALKPYLHELVGVM